MNLKGNTKKFFYENGYFVLENFLSNKEISHYIDKINKIFNLNKKFTSSNDFYGCPDGVTKHNAFWSIIFNKKLILAIEKILGEKIKYTQHSDIHVNLPAGAFHRDNAYRNFGEGPDWDEQNFPYKVVRVAIYLTDFKESGSSLIILPKSNKNESFINKKEYVFWNYLRHYWRKYFNSNKLDHFFFTRKIKKLETKPGDCIIFDQRLIHAGGCVKGNFPKYSIFLSYGVNNEHSLNHHKFYLSRETYLKKLPSNLKKKLKKENLLLIDN